jgi:hypothetical protein
MEACFGPTGYAFLHWLAGVISSFAPWPALILILLAFPSVRNGIGTFAGSFAELPRTVTAVKMAGMKINLDPNRAKELLSISSEVVLSDFERVIDGELRRLKAWDKFEAVIKNGLMTLIDPALISGNTEQSPYRVTLHMQDSLMSERTLSPTNQERIGSILFPLTKLTKA